MNDLADLLDLGVPEPSAFLDPDDLMRRARRRYTTRRAAGLAVIASVAVVGGTAMLAPRPSHPAAVGGATGPTVSALDDATALPPDVVGGVGPAAAQPYQPTGLGVLAQQFGQTKIYLESTSHNGICLRLRSADGSGSGSCRAVADLVTTPLYLATQLTEGQPTDMTVVMPDGYTTLTMGSYATTAVSNVAYLPAITSTMGVMTGPHVSSRTIDLGSLRLPTPGVTALPSGSAVAHLPYPVNAHGLTYGSLADAPTHGGKDPDLIAASGLTSSGAHVDGYFKHADMPVQADPKSPSEAAALMASAIPPTTIPLYAVDGTTVLGTFTFDGRAASP